MEYEISNRRVYLLYSKILGAQLGGRLGGVRLFSGSNGQGWMWLRSAKWGKRKVPAGSRAVPLAGQKKRPNVISNLNPIFRTC